MNHVMAITNIVSMSCAIAATLLLALTQNCPAIPAIAGGLLICIGTVSNAGIIILTDWWWSVIGLWLT
jgi:F0F1-type ATP synthase assembly protein I